ncbi:MAG: hypothetical protein HKN25_13105 [Pyrinomonadaceae bacterium]|nr:hypothetical protein [Pyrinomonadaceae bacterium]
MIKLLILTLSFIFLFGNIDDDPLPVESEAIFDVSTLSVEGQDAYGALLNARQFEDSHVGFAGTLSTKIADFNTLLKEKNADAAFKSILKKGTIAGQLYGLSGIFFTDHSHFKTEALRYAESGMKVEKLSGCLAGSVRVSEIVFSKRENVAIISSGETIEKFWKNNKKTYVLDIAHGGYPALFKHYGKK